MTKKCTKSIGFVATLAAVPLLVHGVAGATAGPGSVGGDDDPNSYPPLPSECADGHLWRWSGDPEVRGLSLYYPTITLPGMTLEPGTATVTEAITWDARPTEPNEWDAPELEPERFEFMRVEFYNDGELVGVSPFHTPDLPDDNPHVWSISTLGSVDLEHGADTVVIAHSSTFTDTDELWNDFRPKSVCIEVAPFEQATTTTTAPTTTAPPTTTTPPVTTAPTPPTSTPTATEVLPAQVETEVLQESVTAAQQLAFTGDETWMGLSLGAALLAIGAGLLGMSRRRSN